MSSITHDTYRAAAVHLLAAIAFCVSSVPSSAQSGSASPNVRFVAEYIRQLATYERIRSTANSELQGDTASKMAGCVRNSTRFQLELQTHISMLQTFRLKPPFDTLPSSLAAFDQHKIDLYRRMGEGCETMLAGPKPNVDYGAIAANAPKITAELEFVEKAMFNAIPLVFASLIDPTPDAQGHMSKLIVTKAERKKMIDDINSAFGKALDQADQNYTVSAASVLRSYLQKDYTSADDRR